MHLARVSGLDVMRDSSLLISTIIRIRNGASGDYSLPTMVFKPPGLTVDFSQRGGDLIYLPPLVDESLDKLGQELLAAGHESKARIDFHRQY